ncbi:hypothetical protein [Spirosoma gilvum]
MMDEINTTRINYHLIPEVMVGISKKLMINGCLFFSNRSETFKEEGGSVYTKYRFLSNDGLQKHFRMAMYGRISYNNSDIHQEEIDLYGHNTGLELGLIATKLAQKVAISSGLSYVKASDNGSENPFIYGKANSKVINYTFSIGKLMLPKEYRAYNQTNLNLMVEFLNQLNTGSGKYYMDIVPSLQLILNSQSRIDISYHREVTSTMIRTAPNGFFIRLEHNFFSIF